MGRERGWGERKMGAGWKPAPTGLITSAHTIVLGPDYKNNSQRKAPRLLPRTKCQQSNVPAQPWDQHS